ncbi:MAG: hypothetical protein H8D60_03075, partial [Cryomorphaceae bacterium]|nr:hypothetical protein [Cryomorphaceae bacterium]
RINKAFLGEMDALQMAQYADSINFNPNDLEVKLHKLGSFNDTLSSITLDTTLIDKEDGLFTTDNNIIYRAVTPTGFLTSNNRYAITIKNLNSGYKVSANTEVISDFSFKNFNSAYKFGFYNPNLSDSSKFLSKTIEWDKSENGAIYQLDIKFNYLENGVTKTLVWSQPLATFTGSSMEAKIEGVKFFNFLSQNLTNDNTVVRQFLDLDLVMTVATENLNTYIKVNEPITGIVQQRPEFTNINNGIGLFTSRYSLEKIGILELSEDTKDYIIENLNLNFQ